MQDLKKIIVFQSKSQKKSSKCCFASAFSLCNLTNKRSAKMKLMRVRTKKVLIWNLKFAKRGTRLKRKSKRLRRRKDCKSKVSKQKINYWKLKKRCQDSQKQWFWRESEKREERPKQAKMAIINGENGPNTRISRTKIWQSVRGTVHANPVWNSDIQNSGRVSGTAPSPPWLDFIVFAEDENINVEIISFSVISLLFLGLIYNKRKLSGYFGEY